ncbi:LOW QUALITY PROTEIN: non-structural maintenance of chromosome element 4 [Drosophila eugracilis]|uniref:LOW QUALITY PROTEIN: non-structural maintenance of chromosome element 4 n=1 Tax=Drosophila eugracilis TaxID=29029 RepID=UPI001BDA7FB3|nr:LOW QUALITY PROTEIN: non-structural maintenance of chromosome element 4 [Drosophila eugracilis]
MSYSDSQSEILAEGSAQDVRILSLQNLIEKNIEIEQQIENKTFDQNIAAIEEIIRTANDITKGHEDRRTNSTELVLDTELLRRNHEVVGKAIQHNTNFTDRMVITAINELVFKEHEEDWDALCALAIPFGRPLFTSDSMLPFIDVTPKEVNAKQRAPRKQKSQVEEKRPKRSDKLERKDEGAASVSYMLRQIKQIYRDGDNQPIPYFKLICNPNNFMDTVQNALQVSFLVKENFISIENGEDGLPLVHVVNLNDAEERESAQAICSIDVSFCEKMAKHYNLHEPMLKRLPVDDS